MRQVIIRQRRVSNCCPIIKAKYRVFLLSIIVFTLLLGKVNYVSASIKPYISIKSNNDIITRAVPGDIITLTMQFGSKVSSISASIDGQDANIIKISDYVYEANIILDDTPSIGMAEFLILYESVNSSGYMEISNVTDESSVLLSDEKNLIDILHSDVDFISSADRSDIETLSHIKLLFDNDIETFSESYADIKLPNGEKYDSYMIFDFKEEGVNLSRIEVLARQDKYYTRIDDLMILGSNDCENWTSLSDDVVKATKDWQIINVNNNDRYRYIMITKINSWYGNLAELRFFHNDTVEYEEIPKITDISIESDNIDETRAYQGNKVKLTFKTDGDINRINAVIDDQKAKITKVDESTYTAEITVDEEPTIGLAKFYIKYTMLNGKEKVIAHLVTDDSTVFLSDKRNLIDIFNEEVDFIDSTTNRNSLGTTKEVSYLFDNKKWTNSDFRLGGNGVGEGSYIIFDFNDKVVNLSRVEVLARQDRYYTRIKGLVIYGSNDGLNWNQLTDKSTFPIDSWQVLYINKDISYRYIKVTNYYSWYGNMAELRLFDKSNYQDSVYEPKATEVSITSDYKNLRKAYIGNVVTLSFDTDEEIKYNFDDLEVIINDKTTDIISEGNGKYTAKYGVDEYSINGLANFKITYINLLGEKLVIANDTTDNSSVLIINENEDESIGGGTTGGDSLTGDLSGDDSLKGDTPEDDYIEEDNSEDDLEKDELLDDNYLEEEIEDDSEKDELLDDNYLEEEEEEMEDDSIEENLLGNELISLDEEDSIKGNINLEVFLENSLKEEYLDIDTIEENNIAENNINKYELAGGTEDQLMNNTIILEADNKENIITNNNDKDYKSIVILISLIIIGFGGFKIKLMRVKRAK